MTCSTLGDVALGSVSEHGPAWARAVGRMAMPRYYASDAEFMTTVVPEACTIADAAGDLLTPLRCRATRTMTIEDLDEYRQLALRPAQACGEPWVAARMHMCVAGCAVADDDDATTVSLERLAAIAEQLDAGSFRFAVHWLNAERLAADLQVREVIARLDEAMALADRASPTVGLFASDLAGRDLCGEPAPLERVTSLLTGSGRDLGSRDGVRVRGPAPAPTPRRRRHLGQPTWRCTAPTPPRCGSSLISSANTG